MVGRTSIRVVWAVVGVAACEGERTTPPTVRTEFDQQVSRLREDSEREITDVRGKWLAAEGHLVRMGRELVAMEGALAAAGEAQRLRLDRLEAELADSRAEILALRLVPASEPPLPTNAEERLLRAYEELACDRRAGGLEPVEVIYARWGFASLDAWASAWAQASTSPDFENRATERTARLCERAPAPTLGSP